MKPGSTTSEVQHSWRMSLLIVLLTFSLVAFRVIEPAQIEDFKWVFVFAFGNNAATSGTRTWLKGKDLEAAKPGVKALEP